MCRDEKFHTQQNSLKVSEYDLLEGDAALLYILTETISLIQLDMKLSSSLICKFEIKGVRGLTTLRWPYGDR